MKRYAEPRTSLGRQIKPAAREPADRRRKIDVGSDHVGEQRVLELAAERGRDANDLPRSRLEVVEARPNHGLHGVRQRQCLRSAFDDRLAAAQRHGALFDERTADLLEEERVAAGAFENALRRGVSRRVPRPVRLR